MKKPISPGPSEAAHLLLRAEDADAVDHVGAARQHQPDALALGELAVDDTHQHDDAEIGVIPAVHEQRFQRLAWRRPWAAGGGARSPPAPPRRRGPVLAEISSALEASSPITSSICWRTRSGSAAGRSILFRTGHDLVMVVERLIDIGQGLRLDALGRIDHEQRAFAGREAAVDLIGEIDMARRVDEVQLVDLAVARVIIEAHGLRLDGDAALALDIHGIEHLLLHLPRRQAPAKLDQPVGERRFAVIDMGDDGEVADAGKRRGLGFTHGGLVRERGGAGSSGRGVRMATERLPRRLRRRTALTRDAAG